MIVNLTQHSATAEQKAAGVVDLYGNGAEKAKRLLTFNTLPSQAEIMARAEQLAALAMMYAVAHTADPDNPEQVVAMIGGAPYLMSALEKCLIEMGAKPVYAYSERVSVETTAADGSVVKENVFRHLGFVTV